MKKLSVFVIVLSLFAFHSFSQDKFFKDYVSRSWNAEDGIPGNSITDIIQSKDGYIFFGTYGGLIRFDGVEFTTINRLYDEKYNFLSARSIMEDSNERLWVGSNDEGAFCITKKGEIFNFSVENGLPNNSVRAFCEDKEGNVWIGTASGIACIGQDLKFVHIPGFATIPAENKIIVSQLYCDTAGRIWIVTKSENGLYVYSDKKFNIYNGIQSIKNPVVTSIAQDVNDAYWFGIAPYYAIKISGGDETLYDVGNGAQKGTNVTCIFQDSAKNIWFGLDNGITILHDGRFSYFNKSNGLADESITKIMEDKEKNIWIATDRGGLEKLSYGKFQTTSMPTTINAILQDKYRKVIWFAGDNGLYCYKNNEFIKNEITEYCKNVRIRHVSLTKDGSLLVCTYDKFGQLKFSLDGKQTKWTKDEGLAGNRIRVAEEMSNGDLYIGTTTGLSIVDGKTGEIFNITKGDKIPNDYIMCLYEDKEGNIWVGTDGGGIFILKDREVIKNITKENNLAGNVIFKISEVREDEIWICTGTGASRYKDGELYTFNSSNGFGTDGVFQLISDFSNRIWGTSNRGIFFVKNDDIDDVINKRKNSVNAKYYNRLDGITSGGVTSTSLSMKDDLGRIWFTLIDGFTIFDPVRNASNNSAPEVTIQEVTVDSEKQNVTNGKIIIPPSAKRINIKYTGISFISSEQVTFKYTLVGFDKGYSEWTNMRMASYTNLKPGKYIFSVVAQNGDEVKSSEDARLEIEKIPYFWQRPWFILFVSILIIGLITLIVLLKFLSMKRENERIEKLSIEVIQALVGTIDAKDKYTNGHSNRVADYALMLSDKIGLSPKEKRNVYYSALLHDIGKIGIPDKIINKPDKLTREEYDIIKSHPVIGSEILSSISSMKEVTVSARGHHERFDGKGYPDKKRGEEIPLSARIICVADAYDAMTSNRSYRKYMKQQDVRSEFVKNRGTQFDPEITDKMIEIIDSDDEYKFHEW